MWSRTPRRRDVENLLQHAGALGLSRAAKTRLHWFAYVLAHQGNVSLTCRYFGISRSTFDRWASRFDPRRPETLEECSRRPHHVRQPETPAELVELVRQYRLEKPVLGKVQIAQCLRADHGLRISASTVGRIISRHRFFFSTSAAHAHKRVALDLDAGAAPPRRPTESSSSSRTEHGEGSVWPASDLPVFGS